MRKERHVVTSLTSLGLTSSQAIELLTHRAIGSAQATNGVLDGLVDSSDRIEGGEVIFWWNDLSKDSRSGVHRTCGICLPADQSDFQVFTMAVVNQKCEPSPRSITADLDIKASCIFSQLLRVYPGQLPSVKLNLFNVVLAFDLSQMPAISFIPGAVNYIIQRGLPFRFGVVPIVETENGR